MKYEKPAFLTLVVSLIALFAGYYYFFSVNFPIIDDSTFIYFANYVHNLDFSLTTLPDFIRQLFRVDNDHSLVIPRLVTLADYAIDGSINFRGLLILITVVTIAVFYLLYTECKLAKENIKYLLPAALLFFQPQYYNVSNWTLSGLNHVFVTFFLVSCLKLVKAEKLSWALLLASFGTFTSGNGLFIFVAMGYVILLSKKYKMLVPVFIVFVINLAIFISFYDSGQANQLGNALAQLPRIAQAFVLLVGSVNYGWLGESTILSYLLGVVVLGLFVWQTVGHWKSTQNTRQISEVLLGVTLFNLITLALIAASRSALDNTSLLISRYQFYALIGTTSVLMLLLDMLVGKTRKWAFIALTGYAFVYFVATYFTYTKIVSYERTKYIADAENWANNRTMVTVHPDFVHNLGFFMKEATDLAIWHPANHLVSKSGIARFIASDENVLDNIISIVDRQVGYSVTSKKDGEVHYVFEINNLPYRPTLTKNWYITLKNVSDNSITFIPISFLDSGKKTFLTTGFYLSTIGYARLNPASLVDGTYELFAYLDAPDKQLFKLTPEFKKRGLFISLE